MGGELSKREGVLFHWWAVHFKAKWWITAVLHRYKPNMNVKTTITLMDIGWKRCFINFSFILRGCFWQWEGALPRSGGAQAPSKPLILRPCWGTMAPVEDDILRSRGRSRGQGRGRDWFRSQDRSRSRGRSRDLYWDKSLVRGRS